MISSHTGKMRQTGSARSNSCRPMIQRLGSSLRTSSGSVRVSHLTNTRSRAGGGTEELNAQMAVYTRKIKEVLRLRYDLGLLQNEIAGSCSKLAENRIYPTRSWIASATQSCDTHAATGFAWRYSSISRISPGLSRNSAERTICFACSAERMPTIAAVTTGSRSVQAIATSPGVRL